MSEPAPYGFTIVVDDDGTPWIALEAISTPLSALGTGQLSFALDEDISVEEAQELVDELNEKIAGIVYTG